MSYTSCGTAHDDTIDWRQRAACAGSPLDLWYQEGSESVLERAHREQLALAYCRECPVVTPCAEEFRRDPWAVAGNTTPLMRGFHTGCRHVKPSRCVGCGHPLGTSNGKQQPGLRRHVGRGLCGTCHDRARRRTREQEAS